MNSPVWDRGGSAGALSMLGGGCCLVQGHLGSALKMPRDPKSSQVPYGLNQERFNRFSPLVCSSFMIRDLTLVPVVT